MPLSNDLISQFVKATNDDSKQPKKDTTLYATVKKNDGLLVTVAFDGAGEDEYATPAIPMVDVLPGDRVMVTIKNHTATITGNLSDPAARKNALKDLSDQVIGSGDINADTVRANSANIELLYAETARIQGSIKAQSGAISELEANHATFEEATAKKFTAADATISTLSSNHANFENTTTNKFTAVNGYINTLSGDLASFKEATAKDFGAVNATIESLDTKYADIEFANIGKAAMETFYAKSGLIENVVVSDGTVTGKLVGVTISGDIIEGNTIVAEKLLIKGEDGLYYKLNTDGETIESEQTDHNSLNGQIIMAKSVTAEKISVDDLVAFGATIGGFNITSSAIYSEIKDAEDNAIRGIYMDTDGQFNFGDESNFIKYYQDEDGTYKLAISAASILYALNGKLHSIEDLGVFGEYVRIGTFEDEPCIELGEADSDFKLIITNTRILFTEGTAVPAHINNQSLHITKAVIEEEIQQGKFVWKVRQNGNMGLVWKGGAS